MVDLAAIISETGSKGIPIGKLMEKSRLEKDVLEDELKRLRSEHQISGPFKNRADYYFVPKFAPSADTVAEKIEMLLARAGKKLSTKSQLEKEIRQPFKKFFGDGLRQLISAGRIVELKGGRSTYLFHIEAASQLFPALRITGLDREQEFTSPSFKEQVADAYHAIKSEQGGFSAVSIGKLLKRVGCSKRVLDNFLLAEAQHRRADLHPSTSLELTAEDREGAVTIPGKGEPAITVTFTE